MNETKIGKAWNARNWTTVDEQKRYYAFIGELSHDERDALFDRLKKEQEDLYSKKD